MGTNDADIKRSSLSEMMAQIYQEENHGSLEGAQVKVKNNLTKWKHVLKEMGIGGFYEALGIKRSEEMYTDSQRETMRLILNLSPKFKKKERREIIRLKEWRDIVRLLEETYEVKDRRKWGRRQSSERKIKERKDWKRGLDAELEKAKKNLWEYLDLGEEVPVMFEGMEMCIDMVLEFSDYISQVFFSDLHDVEEKEKRIKELKKICLKFEKELCKSHQVLDEIEKAALERKKANIAGEEEVKKNKEELLNKLKFYYKNRLRVCDFGDDIIKGEIKEEELKEEELAEWNIIKRVVCLNRDLASSYSRQYKYEKYKKDFLKGEQGKVRIRSIDECFICLKYMEAFCRGVGVLPKYRREIENASLEAQNYILGKFKEYNQKEQGTNEDKTDYSGLRFEISCDLLPPDEDQVLRLIRGDVSGWSSDKNQIN